MTGPVVSRRATGYGAQVMLQNSPRRHAAVLALSVAALLAAAGPVRARERLLVPELPGWTVADTHADPVAEVTELVPSGQTSDTWTRRLTVQAFIGSPMSAGEFLDGLAPHTAEVCEGFLAGPVVPAASPGVEGGRRTITCGKYRGDGRGSVTLFYVLRGKSALFVLARAWRGDPFKPDASPVDPAELAEWNALFDGVRLCDTEDPARPCPQGAQP